MLRVPLNSLADGTILQPGTFLPAVGASALIYVHDPDSTLWPGGVNAPVAVTVYTSEAGSASFSPVPTDSNGQLQGWVESGQDLDIVVSYESRTAGPAVASPLRASSVVSVSPPDTGANAAARIAVAHEAPLNVEWPEYGASPTASQSANVTAINAAIAALPSNGGEILLPRRYPTNGTISLDGRENVKLNGLAGQWDGASGIDYHGTGTAVSIRGTGGSTDGCVLSNLAIADAAATASKLVDLGTSSGTPTDPGSSNCKLDSVALVGDTGAATLLNLAQAISGSFKDVAFSGGAIAVQGVAVAGGFSNSHTFEGACLFSGQSVIPVKNPDQNWSFIGSTVEPLASGAAGFLTMDTAIITAVDGFTMLGVSCQDSNGSGDWVQIAGHGIALLGCMLDASCARHVKLIAATDGLTIIGNRLSAAKTFAVDLNGQTTTQVIILGNSWNNGGLDVNGNPGQGSIVSVPGTDGFTVIGWQFLIDGNLQAAYQSTAGQESTGAGSAALGSNCPAVTATAPYKWIKMETSDGSTVYVPAWK